MKNGFKIFKSFPILIRFLFKEWIMNYAFLNYESQ